MFIAHAPAGYLLAKALFSHRGKAPIALVSTVIIASIAPDLDLLYFYFFDHRANNHHDYWSHIPLYWLAIYYLTIIVAMLIDKFQVIVYATAILAGVMLHFVLDTIAGGIQWGYPFFNQHIAFVTIPVVYDWWVLNFILHWTFLLELLVVAIALGQARNSISAIRKFAFGTSPIC